MEEFTVRSAEVEFVNLEWIRRQREENIHQPDLNEQSEIAAAVFCVKCCEK